MCIDWLSTRVEIDKGKYTLIYNLAENACFYISSFPLEMGYYDIFHCQWLEEFGVNEHLFKIKRYSDV